MLDLNEAWADKCAMESLKYENLEIENHGDIKKEVDRLCALNLPGLFKQKLNEFSIPHVTEIFNSLQNHEIDIAVTPLGNADSPLGSYFVQPYITKKPLSHLLEKLNDRINSKSDGRHYYFQSQNDNLNELSEITNIPKELKLGSVLGEQQAANLWIGTKGTISRLHNDNFDNVYMQLSGCKRIYLLPPTSVREVNEQTLRVAQYNKEMEVVPCDLPKEYENTVFPTYNPSIDLPISNLFVVDLYPGDVLFMPALWYHQIEILSNEINTSINYWFKPFDDEYRWAQWNFQRVIANELNQAAQ